MKLSDPLKIEMTEMVNKDPRRRRTCMPVSRHSDRLDVSFRG
jgi:hypothetical protein